jgi:DNA-binding IclR family transcriptional regulator
MSKGDKTEGSPVDRIFSVLTLVAQVGAVSASDLSNILNIPRPSAYRLISSLERAGLLQQTLIERKYGATKKLLKLVSALFSSTGIYAPAQSILSALAEETGETHGLTVMSMGEVQFLLIVEKATMVLQFQPGQRAPLHCVASGHVFLAGMEPGVFERYLRAGPWVAHTAETITSPDALRKRIAKVQSLGHAVIDSEYIMGVVSVSVPVFDRDRRVIAAIGATAYKPKRSAKDLESIIPVMKIYSKRLTQVL